MNTLSNTASRFVPAFDVDALAAETKITKTEAAISLAQQDLEETAEPVRIEDAGAKRISNGWHVWFVVVPAALVRCHQAESTRDCGAGHDWDTFDFPVHTTAAQEAINAQEVILDPPASPEEEAWARAELKTMKEETTETTPDQDIDQQHLADLQSADTGDTDMTTPETITQEGPQDQEDREWLEFQVAALAAIRTSAAETIRDIAANWEDGRNLSRLYPNQTPAQVLGAMGQDKGYVSFLLKTGKHRQALPEAAQGISDNALKVLPADLQPAQVRKVVQSAAKTNKVEPADVTPAMLRAKVTTKRAAPNKGAGYWSTIVQQVAEGAKGLDVDTAKTLRDTVDAWLAEQATTVKEAA